METFDYQSQFERMKQDTVSAFTKALNIDGRYRQLKANKVWIDDTVDPADWESQKQAVRNDKTWGVPVYASLELLDRQTGKVISEANKVKVAVLPKGTDIGSFIIGGKHYQVNNQLRRKPGVYVTQLANKAQYKTEFNIPGKPFDIALDQESGVFYLVKKQGKQPLYPILSQMGVSDGMMAKQWGQDLLDANKGFLPARQATAAKKVAAFFTGEQYDSPESAAKGFAEFLADKKLAPEVTQKTLGSPIERVTPDILVRGAHELLRTYRGERQPDDRQSIEFKKILSVADFIKERMITEDGGFAPKIQEFRRKIASRLNNRRNLPSQVSRVVAAQEFTPIFDTFFTQTDLSHTPEQNNPLHILNGLSKVTISGEGGAQSEHAIKEEERMVHPSHLGFIDPIHTPESGNIGTVMQLPLGASKNNKGQLLARLYDPKTKQYVSVSPADFQSKIVAMPDQFREGKFVGTKVKAMAGGDMQVVNAADVDLVLPNAKQAFSISSNVIPFLPSAQGVRGLMATKMLEQAIPLVHREAPLVQVKLGKDTIEKHIGSGYSISAKEDGVIEKVTANRIHIKTKDGSVEQPLFNNYPLNSKAFLHAVPLVEAGHKVKKGDVIADSNFTRDGHLAIGTNLRAGYVPFKGYNFEDGIVITESAAAKLSSEHMYKFGDALDKDAELSMNKYTAWRQNDLTNNQVAKLDGDGVVKKGQVLHKGDPMWVGVRDNKTDPDSIQLSKLTRLPPKRPFKETWDNEVDGEVVDVVRTAGKVKVYVKTVEPAQIGDKLTNRHGAKGIITKIIPDGESPHDAAGKPIDIILNPHGIVTRINPSQILETAAAKIAEKTGKPYIVENFSNEDYTQKVKDDLKKHNLKDTELLFDPTTNKPIGEVLVGPQFILKLTKQATSQFSAREEGKYDINRAPLRGGEEGSKAVDLLTMYSALAHGARANLREMATYKASKNDQFWQWLRAGSAAGLVKPPPEPTFAYKKFESYLKAAGVNVERRGSKMVLQPMTDKETTRLSSGAVKEPMFLRAKDLQQEKGGFMDPIIFGRDHDQWGHIDLAEPMPNPVFETPIKTLTGMNNKQFSGLVNGKLFFDPKTNEWNAEQHGLTGGAAVKELLSRIDIDEDIKKWTDAAKTASTPVKLDKANKQLKYLHALKKNKLRPEDAYVQTKIPVLPPQYRPVSPLPDGSLSVQGINWLYRDLGLINNELKWQHGVHYIPEDVKSELRENLYNGAKALAGLGEPIAFYQQSRTPKGFIQQIAGKPAKEGFFQREVIRRKQNLVGRGTIIPEPKLGIDEVGLPEDMAWNLFRPFAIRQMVGLGKKPDEAMNEYDARTTMARSSLEAVMKDRPVILNRAPTLHKFGLMAFNPKITDGDAVKIPPLVVKGFNADFDGDTMTVHVPLLTDAVEEARKMYPSRNLYNPGTGGIVISPGADAALGLFMLSKGSPAERDKILSELPEGIRGKFKNKLMDKNGLRDLFEDLAKNDPTHFGKVVDKLKDAGDQHAYRIGFTVGLKDLTPALPITQGIAKKMQADVAKLHMHGKFDAAKQKEATDLIGAADKAINKALPGELASQHNNFFQMVNSGARGNIGQLKQIISGPTMTDNHHGDPSSIPVTHSYAEGLPFSEYWQTSYGARRVTIDKQLQTQHPGAFTKDILATSGTNIISDADCKTHDGIKLLVGSQGKDIEDRFLARDIKVGPTVIAHAGTVVTPGLMNIFRERKVKEVEVRSPLTCHAPKGTCSKCYGLYENGQLPPLGENVGVISGQAMSEPLTQMTLRTFHSGGASGSRGIISGYDKIDKLLKMPKVIPSKATLSEHDGKVEKIDKAAGNVGENIWIGGKKHYIPKDLVDPRVRVGSKIAKGDAISLGLIKPQELQRLKGMLPAQNYITDQIQQSYKEQDISLKRRAIETVIRSVTNTTKVIDPGDSAFIHGDIAPYTVVEDFNRKLTGKKPVNDAVGMVLKEDVGHFKHGTLISDQVAKAIIGLGKHEVKVGNKPIIHEPFLTGVGQIPFMRNDWMSHLGYQRLEEGILQGVAKGAESDIHDYSPIPAFAYGAEFGLGEKGKY